MLNKNNKKKLFCSLASKNKCLTALICLVYFNIQTAKIIQKNVCVLQYSGLL